MAPLTYADLRQLVRLRREYVDGAEQQLAEIIATRADELPAVLGFPAENLRRLHEAKDPVAVLAGTVEAAPKLWRDDRARAQRAAATTLATRLGASVQFEDGKVILDVALLSAMLTSWPGRGSIAVGSLGCFDVATVRALLRECRKVRAISAVISGERMVVVYETPSSTGHVALFLQPVVEGEDVLVVPLRAPSRQDVAQELPQTVEPPSHGDAPRPPAVLRHPIRTPGPPSRPSTGFFGHLVAAAFEAIGGVR